MTKDSSPVTKRTRFEVFKRDEHRCRYCGATQEDARLTIDHVIPRSLGGTNEPTNLVTACSDCNAGKSSSNPDDETVQDVSRRAFLWKSAIEEAAERRRAERAPSARAIADVGELWTSRYRHQPADHWQSSIRNFVSAGLTAEDLVEFMEVGLQRGTNADHAWRYFCKIAWSEVTTLQQEAEQIIADRDRRVAEITDLFKFSRPTTSAAVVCTQCSASIAERLATDGLCPSCTAACGDA